MSPDNTVESRCTSSAFAKVERNEITTYMASPDDGTWRWVGVYQAFKIHVVALFDVGCIQTSTQTKFRMGFI